MPDRWNVIATDAFADDLEAASSQYSLSVGSVAVSRFMDEYEETVGRLELFPLSGARIASSPYRRCGIGAFIGIYRVLEESRSVSLMRLVYMSSNWKSRLEPGEDPMRM